MDDVSLINSLFILLIRVNKTLKTSDGLVNPKKVRNKTEVSPIYQIPLVFTNIPESPDFSIENVLTMNQLKATPFVRRIILFPSVFIKYKL